MSLDRDAICNYFLSLQDLIVGTLEKEDEKNFHVDSWERPGGGGGRTKVLMDGSTFEKAGVNFSDVSGEFSEEFAKQIPGDGRAFTACGISLVLHPKNPFVPTVHANFRYLTRGNRSWFGGGVDLTPYYPFREDVISFHKVWHKACTTHSGVADYDKLKSWCDEYFHLPHRNEPRGVGGIFFDYLDKNLDEVWSFVQGCGDSFLSSYLPIVQKRKTQPYSEVQKEFQEYRRGRYVEFNLLYDRGTIFGLKTGGRIESILMSLPLKVRWVYDYQPTPGSQEAELYEIYLKPRDWAREV
jgi:coproporphyrinogen III oxidase